MTRPPVRRRGRRRGRPGSLRAGGAGAALTVAAVAALGLAGCANGDALSLARRACGHVQRSISLYRTAAADAPGPAQQAAASAALAELRLALPLAATAAGEAPQWQALMTTLSESSRVPESDLVSALQQQCADATTGTQPAPPPGVSASTTTPTIPTVGR